MANLSYQNKQVHIIFDFIRQLLILAKKFDTNKFVFCWDSRNSWRKLYSPIYKSNRHKDQTPEQEADLLDAYRQMDELKNTVLPYMGFKNSFYQNGYESDDLIAKVILDNRAGNKHFIIVSSDEDLYQLLAVDVDLYNFKRIFSCNEFLLQYGIDPIVWPDVKAISGCPGDNVIGIKGIGNKTACKYLLGQLKGKTKDKIESTDGKRIWEFNLLLVNLPYKGLKPINNLAMVSDEISEDKFKLMFGQYGFRYFLKEENWEHWQNAFFE